MTLYTFTHDLAEVIAADNQNEQSSGEEVPLSTIEDTADDNLTRFALRLALAGHVGIPALKRCLGGPHCLYNLWLEIK